jgi:hypothetical protein
MRRIVVHLWLQCAWPGGGIRLFKTDPIVKAAPKLQQTMVVMRMFLRTLYTLVLPVCCLLGGDIPLHAQAPKPGLQDPEALAIAQKIAEVYGGPVDYIQDFMAACLQLEATEGIPASMVLGIAILESGGFTSFLFENALNPFGMRATYPWNGAVFEMYHEGANAAFRQYRYADEAVSDFRVLLYEHPWLADALNCPDKSVNCYLERLSASEKPKHPGYSRDPRWAEKIKNIIQRYGLDKL